MGRYKRIGEGTTGYDRVQEGMGGYRRALEGRGVRKGTEGYGRLREDDNQINNLEKHCNFKESLFRFHEKQTFSSIQYVLSTMTIQKQYKLHVQ